MNPLTQEPYTEEDLLYYQEKWESNNEKCNCKDLIEPNKYHYCNDKEPNK